MAETINKPTDVVTGKTEGSVEVQTPAAVADQTETQTIKKPVGQTEDPGTLYCDALNEQNINKVADGKVIDRVVLVGFVGYGKSTYASSLYYNFFSKENFCDHVMCDSETYSGFERRMLIRSMKIAPDEKRKRTMRGENPLLVMLLDSQKTGKYKFVVSDRSGEDYAQFAGTQEEINDNQIMKVADHVVFFIDCEKMIDNFGSLRYAYQNLLRDLVSKGLLNKNSNMKLVFNKYDMRKNHPEYGDKKLQTEKMFKTALGEQSFEVYEIDSTGASDNFESVEKLTRALLLEADGAVEKNRKLIDWVNAELND